MSTKDFLLTCVVCLLLVVCEGFQGELAVKKIENRIQDAAFLKPGIGSEKEINKDDISGAVPYTRRKRALGSILVMTTSILMRGSSLGINIAGAVTGGCAFYSSICRDKAEIENLDSEINRMKRNFDAIYRENGRSFVDLKQADVNNGYISYYTNETVRSVESIQELTARLIERISLKDFPIIANNIEQNLTPEKYLETVVEQLEYSLEYLTERIQRTKQNLLVGIAVQYLAEALLNRFMTAYTSAYGQITEDIFFQSQIQNMFNPDYIVDQKKLSFFKNVKLIPKVFKQMGKNVGKYFKNGWRSLKKWKRINSWKGFKGKLLHSMRKPLAKMRAVKQFMTSSAARRHAVRNFKLGWSQKIAASLGIIADAINIGLSIHEWSKVRDEMARAKENYRKYKTDLSNEIKHTKVEAASLGKEWESSIQTFRDVTKSIRTLFTDLARNSDFNGVMGLSGLPVNFVSAYLPSNFENIHKGNILSKQAIMIDFLRKINNDFTKIREDLNARLIMYDYIDQSVKTNKSIVEMLHSLKNIYKYKTGQEKLFGASLSERPIICTTAIKFPQKTDYDFYSLTSLRPVCQINNEQFASLKADALEKRKRVLMEKVVTNEVINDSSKSLEHLLNMVKNAYSYATDPSIRNYGNTITEKDVSCTVASKFPAMQQFDFLPLAPLRPDCATVSDSDFVTMKQGVKNKKLLGEKIGGAMYMCDQWKYCPCIANILAILQTEGIRASGSDIKAAIKTVKPDLNHYCGTTGCTCVNLYG